MTIGELRLPLLASGVGIVVAFGGIGLLRLISLITNFAYHGKFSVHEAVPGFGKWGALAIAIPALGGLLIGIIARYGSPDVRGHGIPEVMQGVVTKSSRIPLRVAILKPLASAISIGTGGPFGAEGPVIATGGAMGSLVGQWIPSSSVERKILLAAGAAAGMTVAFGTPLAGLLLAIELLLFEFRGRSFIPVALATVMATVVRSAFAESYPMLPLHLADSVGIAEVIVALIIGSLCGGASVGVTHALHGIEHAFEKLPVHWMWWPALGGLAVGLIGYLDPRTLGPGYENLREMLEGNLSLAALGTLLLFKFLSWALCLGSGTSGGTVAPIMTLGGAIGGMTLFVIHPVGFFSGVPVGLCVLVGMVALFAGISRAFLTSVAFGLEATHASSAAAPLLLGCAVAILISRLCMHESMMTEKLARKGVRVPSDYEPDALIGLTVSGSMILSPTTVPPEMPVSRLAGLVTGNDPVWTSPRVFPIIGHGGVLLGIISRADDLEAMEDAPAATVLEAGMERPVTIHGDDSLAEAADRMIIHSIGRLPVVDRSSPPLLCGLISRREILEARQHRLADETRHRAVARANG